MGLLDKATTNELANFTAEKGKKWQFQRDITAGATAGAMSGLIGGWIGSRSNSEPRIKKDMLMGALAGLPIGAGTGYMMHDPRFYNRTAEMATAQRPRSRSRSRRRRSRSRRRRSRSRSRGRRRRSRSRSRGRRRK